LRNKGKNETGVEQPCRNRENGIVPDGVGKKEGRQKLMQAGKSDKSKNERIQGYGRKKKRNEYRPECFLLLVMGVYLSERVVLVVDVQFSESIVGKYQHT